MILVQLAVKAMLTGPTLGRFGDGWDAGTVAPGNVQRCHAAEGLADLPLVGCARMPNVGPKVRPLPPRGGLRSIVRAWRWLHASLRDRGARCTVEDALSTVEHYWFDVRYGTHTRESVPLNALGVAGNNRPRGVGYQPTAPALFHRVMRQLTIPRGSVFVDLGCGKGRALLLASRYGFSRLVGVEFSPVLCEAARRNVEIFRHRTGAPATFEIVEADVADYRIEDDQNVFYLFNPFDGVVLDAVLDHLEASRRRKPRMVWLIYLFPTQREAIEQRRTFAPAGFTRYGSGEVLVYRSAAQSG